MVVYKLVVYSIILVDVSPTFYCLLKPLLVHGSMLLYDHLTVGSIQYIAGRPGSSEVPRNPLTRWDVSSIPANGIFLTKKQK